MFLKTYGNNRKLLLVIDEFISVHIIPIVPLLIALNLFLNFSFVLRFLCYGFFYSRVASSNFASQSVPKHFTIVSYLNFSSTSFKKVFVSIMDIFISLITLRK